MLRQYDRVGTHCGLRFSQYLLWMIQLNSDKIHENIAAAAFYYRVLTYTDTQENCLSAELAADKITAADLWKICTASNLTMLKICRAPSAKPTATRILHTLTGENGDQPLVICNPSESITGSQVGQTTFGHDNPH